MEIFTEFIINFFRALFAVGIIGVLLAFLAIVTTFVFDYKNIREEKSRMSSSVGNALLVLHSFFEPGAKPQTEQIIKIKKRRTPVERKVLGLSEFGYDELYIKGYKHLENKKYVRSKTRS